MSLIHLKLVHLLLLILASQRKFNSGPTILVSLEHERRGAKHDASTVWLEDVTATSFKICVRELQNFDGAHESIHIVSCFAYRPFLWHWEGFENFLYRAQFTYRIFDHFILFCFCFVLFLFFVFFEHLITIIIIMGGLIDKLERDNLFHLLFTFRFEFVNKQLLLLLLLFAAVIRVVTQRSSPLKSCTRGLARVISSCFAKSCFPKYGFFSFKMSA